MVGGHANDGTQASMEEQFTARRRYLATFLAESSFLLETQKAASPQFRHNPRCSSVRLRKHAPGKRVAQMPPHCRHPHPHPSPPGFALLPLASSNFFPSCSVFLTALLSGIKFFYVSIRIGAAQMAALSLALHLERGTQVCTAGPSVREFVKTCCQEQLPKTTSERGTESGNSRGVWNSRRDKVRYRERASLERVEGKQLVNENNTQAGTFHLGRSRASVYDRKPGKSCVPYRGGISTSILPEAKQCRLFSRIDKPSNSERKLAPSKACDRINGSLEESWRSDAWRRGSGQRSATIDS